MASLPLAQELDKAIASPNEQNKNLVLALSLGLNDLNDAQISQAASELQPLLEGATNRAIADSSRHTVQAINEQALSGENQVWAKAIANDSRQKANHQGLSGYNDTNVGAVVGASLAVKDSNVGFALSHTQGKIDSQGATNHRADTKTNQAFIYTKHEATQGTQLYGHVGVGQSDIDGKRHIRTLAQTTANAKYKANIAQAGLGISHQIGSPDKNITPFTRIDYTKVTSDAYQETGAGVYNLSVAKNKYQSLSSTIGVQANYHAGNLALNATVAGVLENGDKHSHAHASLAGGAVNFDILGHEVGKTSAIFGVGLGYELTPKVKLSLDYQGQWRKNHDTQSATVALTTKF